MTSFPSPRSWFPPMGGPALEDKLSPFDQATAKCYFLFPNRPTVLLDRLLLRLASSVLYKGVSSEWFSTLKVDSAWRMHHIPLFVAGPKSKRLKKKNFPENFHAFL